MRRDSSHVSSPQGASWGTHFHNTCQNTLRPVAKRFQNVIRTLSEHVPYNVQNNARAMYERLPQTTFRTCLSTVSEHVHETCPSRLQNTFRTVSERCSTKSFVIVETAKEQKNAKIQDPGKSQGHGGQPTNSLASQPASQPAKQHGQSASQPARQPATQTARPASLTSSSDRQACHSATGAEEQKNAKMQDPGESQGHGG